MATGFRRLMSSGGFGVPGMAFGVCTREPADEKECIDSALHSLVISCPGQIDFIRD